MDTKYTRSFGGDIFIQNNFTNLVKKYNPDFIIETGTYTGFTTIFLASFNIPVITTEINKHKLEEAKKYLKYFSNINYLFGDSSTKLLENFNLLNNKKIIFFLDSHWLNDFSLERELQFIATLLVKPIILIHDFKVPEKDYKYENYDGHDYDFIFYKPYIDKIYGIDNYEYYYNTESNISKPVGIITILPKNI
jgi:hypothetical protein